MNYITNSPNLKKWMKDLKELLGYVVSLGAVNQHKRRYNIFQFPNINIINVVKEGDIYED
jgi:hypothetical protein